MEAEQLLVVTVVSFILGAVSIGINYRTHKIEPDVEWNDWSKKRTFWNKTTATFGSLFILAAIVFFAIYLVSLVLEFIF